MTACIADETPITAENLLAQGYKEFPPSQLDRCDRAFQRAIFKESVGRLHFITFRYWQYGEYRSFDAQLTCKSGADGYLWATVKESTIEATEKRIAALWKAAGEVPYDD